MTAEKDKTKNGRLHQRAPAASAITPANLLVLCRARGLSVAALARKIGRSRQTVYFAVENPRRFSIAFRKIQNALL